MHLIFYCEKKNKTCYGVGVVDGNDGSGGGDDAGDGNLWGFVELTSGGKYFKLVENIFVFIYRQRHLGIYF